VLLFLAIPVLTYLFYPPEIRRGDALVSWAKEEFRKLGRIKRAEALMALLAVLALTGWIAGARWMAPVTVALCVVGLMLLSGIVSCSQIAGDKQVWTVLVWFATLVAMADGLHKVGFLDWLALRATGSLSHFSPLTITVAAMLLFFVIHYLFASLTAHTAAVLPVMLAAVMMVPGIAIRPVAMLMCYSLGLMGVLTPYASGPAPIWYANGYIPAKDFWRLGLLTGVLFLIVLLALGVPYEETAAFAAGADAHLTGKLAVCAGSCGPGNLHLINGLYDCQRSRVPVLAIAAQIPSSEIGSNYFQETNPQHLFAEMQAAGAGAGHTQHV